MIDRQHRQQLSALTMLTMLTMEFGLSDQWRAQNSLKTFACSFRCVSPQT